MIPEFIWREWGKHEKTSVKTAGFGAEIWIQDLPNTKQQC
jgi:hypothetical protein